MEKCLNTFRVSQTHHPLQFEHYNGPKQRSQLTPSEIPFSEDGVRSNAERENNENLGPASDQVELVDLTCSSDEEGNCEIHGSGGGESSKVSRNDCLSLMTEQKGVISTPREDPRDKASHQPAPSKSSSQGNIKDSQYDSEADEGDSHEDDADLQISDQLEVPTISSPDHRGREFPTNTNDTIDSETGGGAKTQIDELSHWQLPSTPPTTPSKMSIEQPKGEAFHCILTKAITHQPQRPTEKKAESEVRLTIVENTSSSKSDIDDDNHRGNRPPSLTCKRKRSPPIPRYKPASNTTSKQRPKRATHSASQRMPSPIRGRPSRPSVLKPPSVAQYSGYKADTHYSDSSDDSSNDSSAHHLASNKRITSTTGPIRWRKHKRARNRSNADKYVEYEVESILDSRIKCKKLQYRVKWLGYEDDPVWYDAVNFKNSPHKLRDFHCANPFRPGPPKRLNIWEQCWEEDRDAEDHVDDNKRERSCTRGGALSI